MKTAFILASVAGGTMIVNRFDCDEKGQGVGGELLDDGERYAGTVQTICRLAHMRQQRIGPGVVLLDGGANIGTFTVRWARFMRGWGQVLAFEPQTWVFYALCGNLAINNCFNAIAFNNALGESPRAIAMPLLDPLKPTNFGGMALGGGEARATVVRIDDMNLPRLDILKLDVEGMEPAALRGAKETIARCKPLIFAESFICTPGAIVDLLPDYAVLGVGGDVICVHRDDDPRLHADMAEYARRHGSDQVR